MTNLTLLTHQITYNRLLRAIKIILNDNVFEHNDNYTRNIIMTKCRKLLQKAKENAIKDYEITMEDFNPVSPHDINLHIKINFYNLIDEVIINVTNENDITS